LSNPAYQDTRDYTAVRNTLNLFADLAGGGVSGDLAASAARRPSTSIDGAASVTAVDYS
jgi:hypothetical protein